MFERVVGVCVRSVMTCRPGEQAELIGPAPRKSRPPPARPRPRAAPGWRARRRPRAARGGSSTTGNPVAIASASGSPKPSSRDDVVSRYSPVPQPGDQPGQRSRPAVLTPPTCCMAVVDVFRAHCDAVRAWWARRADQHCGQQLVPAQRHPWAGVPGIHLRVADQVLAAISRAGDSQRSWAHAARHDCHVDASAVTDDGPPLGGALSSGGAQRGRDDTFPEPPAPPWSWTGRPPGGPLVK